MKIIRFFIIFFIIIILITPTSKSFARTVGNYIGVDAIETSLAFSMEKHYDDQNTKSIHTYTTPSVSFGVKYGYAINYKGLFIAPNIIFENNKNKNFFNRNSLHGEVDINYYGRTYSKISKRYGVKLDIGADLTNNFALYGVVGYARNYYENLTSIYYYKDYAENKFAENPWVVTRGNKIAPFFGAGFRINLFQHWSFNGEYNQTNFKSKSNAKTQANPQNVQPIEGAWQNKISLNNEVRIIKLGINYNF